VTSWGTIDAPYWPLQTAPATEASSGGGGHTQGVDALALGRMVLTGLATDSNATLGSASGAVSFAGLATPVRDYAQTVVHDGAVAYYRLNDPASSTTIADTIAGGTSGSEALSASTPPTFQEPPIAAFADSSSHALLFPGSTGTPFSIPSVFNGGDWSIEFWMNTTSTVGSSGVSSGSGNQWYGEPNILGGDIPGAAPDFGLCMAGGQIGIGIGENDVTFYTAGTYNDGKDHYVVVTRSASSGDLVVYVDNQEAGAWTGPTGTRNGSNPQWIGGNPDGAGSSGNWEGTLQEFALYNSVLTATQVANHYQLGRAAVVVVASGAGALSLSGSAVPSTNAWPALQPLLGKALFYSIQDGVAYGPVESFGPVTTSITASGFSASGLPTTEAASANAICNWTAPLPAGWQSITVQVLCEGGFGGLWLGGNDDGVSTQSAVLDYSLGGRTSGTVGYEGQYWDGIGYFGSQLVTNTSISGNSGWLRITSALTCYVSSNGSTWTQVGQISLPTPTRFGVIVNAWATSTLDIAFSDLSVGLPSGSGNGSLTFAGSATGAARVVSRGVGAGALVFSGAATAIVEHNATGTGSLFFSGAAGGALAARGSGALALQGSGSGRVPQKGPRIDDFAFFAPPEGDSTVTPSGTLTVTTSVPNEVVCLAMDCVVGQSVAITATLDGANMALRINTVDSQPGGLQIQYVWADIVVATPGSHTVDWAFQGISAESGENYGVVTANAVSLLNASTSGAVYKVFEVEDSLTREITVRPNGALVVFDMFSSSSDGSIPTTTNRETYYPVNSQTSGYSQWYSFGMFVTDAGDTDTLVYTPNATDSGGTTSLDQQMSVMLAFYPGTVVSGGQILQFSGSGDGKIFTKGTSSVTFSGNAMGAYADEGQGGVQFSGHAAGIGRRSATPGTGFGSLVLSGSARGAAKNATVATGSGGLHLTGSGAGAVHGVVSGTASGAMHLAGAGVGRRIYSAKGTGALRFSGRAGRRRLPTVGFIPA